MPRNLELERLVQARPDDPKAHLVYADWLKSQGDPRGDVIESQLSAAAEPPKARRLKARAKKLLDEHIEQHWAPKYPALADRFRSWNKGLRQPSADGIVNWSSSQLLFRWGLLRSVGMLDWPAPLVEAGLGLLGDEDAAFVEELTLKNTRVADLSVLSGLRSLRVLDLSGAKKVNGLEPLSKLERLEELSLNGTAVSDLKPLAALPRLYRLSLNGTRITKLNDLAAFRALEFLSVENTAVKDVKPLRRLRTLWEVWLYQTDVPERAGEALEAAMKSHPSHTPRCRSGLHDGRIVYGP